MHEFGNPVPKKSFIQKYGPTMFWTAIAAAPLINLGTTYLGYRTASLNHATELLKKTSK